MVGMRNRKSSFVAYFLIALATLEPSAIAEVTEATKSHPPSEEEMILQLPTATFELQEITKDNLSNVESECRRLSEAEGKPYQLVMGMLKQVRIIASQKICRQDRIRFCTEYQKRAELGLSLTQSHEEKTKIFVRLFTFHDQLTAAPFEKYEHYAFCATSTEGLNDPTDFRISSNHPIVYRLKDCILCLF